MSITRRCTTAADLPIFIYNIPGRSAVDMTTETMAELFKLPRIVGIKDAGGDVGTGCGRSVMAMGPGVHSVFRRGSIPPLAITRWAGLAVFR